MTLTPHGPVVVAREEDEKTFCPEDLTELAEQAKKQRTDCLLMDESGADEEAEQFFLLAMAQLEQAERYFRLASLKQSQALAGRR